jgi:large subunit ribosomal protein L10
MSLYKVPTSALQKIKNELAPDAVIKVERKSVLHKALEKTGKHDLTKHLSSQPAVIMSGMNPFKLYKFIRMKKTRAAAKPGDIAQQDIVVPAGPTDIPPGPAISALTTVKVSARVEGGKIAVAKDSPVAKAGDVISPELASALSMLKLQPMEIGLDISALMEEGMVYGRDVLAVDETKILADLSLAAGQAFNLSLNAGYPTKKTIGPMITKAFLNAKSLGIEAGILDEGVIGDLLAKAKRQAEALASKIPAQ